MEIEYRNPARKKGAASWPVAIREAPMNVLSALGSLQSAAVTPDAIPRSSSSMRPMIIDWESGLAMFIRKALMQ